MPPGELPTNNATSMSKVATASRNGSARTVAHLPASLQVLTLPAGVHSTLAPDLN
jgi:hypothetical protein